MHQHFFSGYYNTKWINNYSISEVKRFKGKALIEENGYSGEYAPAFSNKLHPCSVLTKIKINNAVYKPLKLALWERMEHHDKFTKHA